MLLSVLISKEALALSYCGRTRLWVLFVWCWLLVSMLFTECALGRAVLMWWGWVGPVSLAGLAFQTWAGLEAWLSCWAGQAPASGMDVTGKHDPCRCGLGNTGLVSELGKTGAGKRPKDQPIPSHTAWVQEPWSSDQPGLWWTSSSLYIFVYRPRVLHLICSECFVVSGDHPWLLVTVHLMDNFWYTWIFLKDHPARALVVHDQVSLAVFVSRYFCCSNRLECDLCTILFFF